MTVSTSSEFIIDGCRYQYDGGLPADFAQLDTSEDASYYGNWASAKRLVLFSYCEGDCTTTICETREEFKAEIEKFQAFCDRVGYRFLGIDPGWTHTPEKLQPWDDCGLSHLIH
jgi:hypothetical protein